MSRSEPESEGLVLRVDQKKWSVLTPFDPFYLGNISWMVSRHALNWQMSRSGPESGGLVLRVDQKKWSVFKTHKQKKNK
jgi:hypothetical protein